MKQAILFSTVVCLITSLVSAENIRGINIEFVTIGNPGNPGDTRTSLDPYGWPLANPYGGGSVGYEYRIGKYEITNAQWNAFVAAAGAPVGNLPDAYVENSYFTGNQTPTNCVSWYEALQFCNYLTSGDKSKGAYQFSGTNSNPGDFLGIDRKAAQSLYGVIYVLPTEDEWYKAAYYKPDGSGYSLYANGRSTIPTADNGWNYAGGTYVLTPWNVGTGTREQNGTYDMMGNIFEWNETAVGPGRGLRGGSFYSSVTDGFDLASSYRFWGVWPNSESIDGGFRIASVPEPATLLLVGVGAVMLRKRK